MNPPTVGGKFAAKDVGGGVPDAPGGVKTPPYDAKDKGDTMARLRAGHARPLRTTVNGSRTKGARGWLPLPFSPTKTKKRDGHCPVSFFLKKKEKNRTSRRRLNANGTTPLQVIPSLRIRQGALVFFLFSCRSEALAFDVLILHLFLSNLQDAHLYNMLHLQNFVLYSLHNCSWIIHTNSARSVQIPGRKKYAVFRPE